MWVVFSLNLSHMYTMYITQFAQFQHLTHTDSQEGSAHPRRAPCSYPYSGEGAPGEGSAGFLCNAQGWQPG